MHSSRDSAITPGGEDLSDRFGAFVELQAWLSPPQALLVRVLRARVDDLTSSPRGVDCVRCGDVVPLLAFPWHRVAHERDELPTLPVAECFARNIRAHDLWRRWG